MTTEAGQSLLVGRLHPDRELARHAGFALFVQVYLETIGEAPWRLLLAPHQGGGAISELPVAELPGAVAAVIDANPHLLAYFRDRDRLAQLAHLDPAASQELVGWLRAQRLDQEEPQIAYELGMLALGVELPPVLVRGLRDVALHPYSRVAELPDGSGYAGVFLSTLHPAWEAARHLTLFVESVDAEQLAGWAMLLLTRQLAPRPGSIRRVAADDRSALREGQFDVALVYNPVPWLREPAAQAAAVAAREVVNV